MTIHLPNFDTQVLNCDCKNLLSKLESNSVDLIATDPPYQINYGELDWDKKQIDWSTIALEFNRVLKESGNILLFQGWSEVQDTKKIFDTHFILKNWIIYDRVKGRGAKTNFVSTREDILWYVKNPKQHTFNKISSTIKKKTGGSIGKRNGNEYRALSNVWTDLPLSNVWSDISPLVPWSKERINHPTQKPLALMERIINIFSNKGDLVLDPFCGSGTTLVAAKKLQRNFIGCDLDKKYCELTKQRLLEIEAKN